MGNFTQNDINFTIEQYTPTKVSNRVSTATQAKLLAGIYGKSVNAVEIDWNGAEITSTVFPAMNTTSNTINTTGDLLSWIKESIEEAAVSGRTSGVVRRSLWIN